MSASIGGLFSVGEEASQARRNGTMVFSGSGDEIVALSSDMVVPIVRCLADGGGKKVNELYFQSADNLSYLNVRRKHYHNSDADEDGGLISKSLLKNPRLIYINDKGLMVNNFIVSKSSLASITDLPLGTIQGIKFLTSATSNEYANAVYPGGAQFGWSKDAILITKGKIDNNANMTVRQGIGMESVESGPDNDRKMGIEGCAGSTFWQLVTATGLARLATPTTTNMQQALPIGQRIVFDSQAPSVVYTDSNGATVTQPSTLPAPGVSNSSRLFRAGIKTTNTTQKEMHLYMLFVVGEDTDTVLFD